jgi:transcriptional regulator with XRE-family HTH domain
MAQLIDSNSTLWRNVEALMLAKYGKVNMNGFAKHCGVGIATIQRIQQQETSIGLAVIEKIAEKFNLAAWQILVPGFDPANPPALQPVTPGERALYEKIMSAAREIVATEPAAKKYL